MADNDNKTDKEKEKEKKDAWKKDNAYDTIEERRDQRQDIINVVDAMDAQLLTEIQKVLDKAHKAKGKEGPASWNYIIAGKKDYDKDVVKDVLKVIDKVYSVDSEFNPLKDTIDKAKLEKNYFNAQLVEGIYHPHKRRLKEMIGTEQFSLAQVKNLQRQNLEKIAKETTVHTISDIDSEEHGDDLYDLLKEEYKFDEDKVNKEGIKRDIAQLMRLFIFKDELPEGIDNKKHFHDNYKKYKKEYQMAA